MTLSRLLAAMCIPAAVALAGCLGGGGDATPATTPAAAVPEDVTISGVAATGAPLSGATINVYDAKNAKVASTVAAADGSYTLVVPSTATAPFVIEAVRDDVALYSPVSSTAVTRVNVTPITTIAAAQLSPTGDPARLAAELGSGAAKFDSARVQRVVADLVQALQPLLSNVGADVDPITGTFAADGTGYDRVLNSLSVAILPAGNRSNIVISVKAATASLDEQPPQVTFTSDQVPPQLPQRVATATLPPTNTDTLIADFLARMEQCFALARSERVTGTTTSDTVKAPLCRGLFWDDDPATFKHNGAIVSSQNAWSTLFADASTGAKISAGKLQLLNPDDSMLVSWRGQGTTGNVSLSRTVLKEQSGALKAYGNQNKYSFTVRPWAETRDFINAGAVSYHASGFDVSLPNVTSAGAPIFDRVVVTTPNGRTLTFKPVAGLSYLPVVNAATGQSTGTSVVRLAGKFMDASLTAKPRTLTGENIFWAINPAGDNQDWTDEEIAAINNLGRWKADFFLAGNTGTTADVTQYVASTARPLTMAELTQKTWAAVVPSLRAELGSASSANGYAMFAEGDPADISADGNLDAWTVPSGAVAPTFVQVQGFAATTGNPRWNDNTNVGTTSRKTVITCTKQSQNDFHCSSVTPGTYSAQARLNLLQLIGYDANDIEWVTSIGLFKPALPAN